MYPRLRRRHVKMQMILPPETFSYAILFQKLQVAKVGSTQGLRKA